MGNLTALIAARVPWQGWDRYQDKDILQFIRSIEFGDRVDIRFHSGMTVEMQGSFDSVLTAIVEDFTGSVYYPELQLVPVQGSKQCLCLTPERHKWLRDFNLLAETIRLMMVTYNLSGDWDENALNGYRVHGGLAAGDYGGEEAGEEGVALSLRRAHLYSDTH